MLVCSALIRAPLVGRQRELALLRTRLEMAKAGAGGLVLLAGEPGIGKTRLAEELANEAQAQAVRPLWGRCYEGEGAPALWPWVQIIRAYARGRDRAGLLSEMGSGAADIAQLVPEVDDGPCDLPVLPSLEPAEARFRLFDTIANFLTRAAARQPLLLIFDDLHWADTSSLLLLRFLARDLGDARLLLVGAYRDSEIVRQGPLAQTLAELAREPSSERLILPGLSESDVLRVVEQSTDLRVPAKLIRAVFQVSDGNPFFVGEVVRLLIAEGRFEGLDETSDWSLGLPQGVRAVVGRRLERLSAPCAATLGIAAVLGREFSLAALMQVSDLTPDVVLGALDEATSARMISEVAGDAGRYRFLHALLREVLYEDLGRIVRIRLHGRVGEALEQIHAADLDPYLPEVAYHFLQAAPGGQVSKAVDYARQAGDHALTLLAYEDAARYYELALEVIQLGPPPALPAAALSGRCQLLLALGEARRRAGDTPAAKQAFRNAAESARAAAAPELLARAALGYSEYPDPSDRLQVEMLEEALQALGARDSPLRAGLLGLLAENLANDAAFERAEPLGRQAVEVAHRTGDPLTLAYALNEQQWTFWGPGLSHQRLAAAGELIGCATRAGHHELALRGHRWRIHALLELGEIDQVDREIDACAHLAAASRLPLGLSRSRQLQAMRALLEGRFAEGQRLAREALAIGQRDQTLRADRGFLMQMLIPFREQGRLPELEIRLREAVARNPATQSWPCALALLDVERGRRHEARRLFERVARDDFAGLPRHPTWTDTLYLLVELCVALGDARRAEVLYALLCPYAEQNAVFGIAAAFGGSASYSLGLLATTFGAWDVAAQCFDWAVSMDQKTGARSFQARTQYAYARMLTMRTQDQPRTEPSGLRAEWERRQMAASLLNEAYSTACELGMTRLVTQIEELTRQDPLARSAARSPQSSSLAGLTARELEILRLLAGGRSNRMIAQELFVSVRTVDHHLANVYRKLHVRGRAEAIAFAVREGLAPGSTNWAPTSLSSGDL